MVLLLFNSVLYVEACCKVLSAYLQGTMCFTADDRTTWLAVGAMWCYVEKTQNHSDKMSQVAWINQVLPNHFLS